MTIIQQLPAFFCFATGGTKKDFTSSTNRRPYLESTCSLEVVQMRSLLLNYYLTGSCFVLPPGMNPDCGRRTLWMGVAHTRIKSAWKQNSRSAAEDMFSPVSPALVRAKICPRQEYKPIGVAHNRRAQPFIAAANIDDKRQVVSASYNTPIGLYSSGNIQDAMEGQIRGLVPQKPQRWTWLWLSLCKSNGSTLSHHST